jgi:5-methylcytosine-specific restriction protein A
MPYRPDTPCKHPDCAKLVPYGTDYCDEHKALHPKPSRNATARGYDRQWRKISKAYLNANPLCVRCKAEGKFVKATVVDHIIPHKGDRELFWDRSNWQSLCKHCHDVKTSTEDNGFAKITYRY